jgi:hypothetical protein
LISYADVKKHASDIVKVTQRRYMPPWPPESGHGDFVGARRLTANDLGILQQWVAEGAPEGKPEDRPPKREWASDWQLGPPDLVVSMPKPYELPAEGRDVYRNFIVPVPITARKYVRALEFRPGNPRVVHHTFIRMDRTGKARQLEENEKAPGFPGMSISAEVPGGHFLSWQPGRGASELPQGLSFELDPGNDFILRMHMNPSGKPEQVQAMIGLYFTDQPPTNSCLRLLLTSTCIDIPPGATNYLVHDDYRLPIDINLIAVLPHAHYLARDIRATATLPDDTVKSLLWIKDWDFNWQSDYRYKVPVFLPRGTVLSMNFTYDNSTNNLRNPNQPPKRVASGVQTSDEMAELWFQFLPATQGDVSVFQNDYGYKTKSRLIAETDFALKKNPADPAALAGKGMLLCGEGRYDMAERSFRAALRSDPNHARAHYGLGLVFRKKEKLREARIEFEKALQSDPWDYQAHGNLGMLALEANDLDNAENHFKEALRLNPDDVFARDGLRDTLQAGSRRR